MEGTEDKPKNIKFRRSGTVMDLKTLIKATQKDKKRGVRRMRSSRICKNITFIEYSQD